MTLIYPHSNHVATNKDWNTTNYEHKQRTSKSLVRKYPSKPSYKTRCHLTDTCAVQRNTVEFAVVGWLVEQGLTSHSTQFRSFRRRCFYRSDDPTNGVKALKEGG